MRQPRSGLPRERGAQGTHTAGATTSSGGYLRTDGLTQAVLVREALRERRLRTQYFTLDLLGEPVWDIMLILLAARLEGRRMSVPRLSIAANVSCKIALRLVDDLIERGLLTRTVDLSDDSLACIALTDESACRISRSLEAEVRRPEMLS